MLVGIECSDVRAQGQVADAQGTVLASLDVGMQDPADPVPALEAVVKGVVPHLDGTDSTAVVALPQSFRADREHLGEVLGPLGARCRAVWRCGAMEAIAAGALDSRPGLVIHSGLRAAAIGVQPDGRVLTAGQADTPLGDDGSALSMAVQVVKMAQQGLSGRIPRKPRLEKALAGYFGRDSFETLLEDLENGTIQAGELAGFVSVVLQMATYPDPDPGCRVLVLQASRHLVDLVRYVIEQSEAGDELRTGTWSGAALEGPLLEEFQRHTGPDVPELRWQPPAHGALRGAVLLARSAHAHPVSGPQPLEPITPPIWQQLFEYGPGW